MGIYEHLMVEVDERLLFIKANLPPYRLQLLKKNIKEVFNLMLFSLDMPDSDITKPMTDAVFKNPYSPEVLLILNLYAMEPPFYAALNKAMRDLDMDKLKTLGPFAMAIYEVLLRGKYSDGDRDDALERGEDFYSTDSLGYFCRSFLLFRGALMNNEWIDGWREKVGEYFICIPGCTSTSKNLEVALGFS